MKLLLFGQIGSGKSYVGEQLAREFGLHYHDADDDLPTEIADAIHRHEPLTDAMRETFADRIIARIAALSATHPRFVIAQALFKNRQRARLLSAFPDLCLVWVRSTPALIAARLEERTGHLASAYYASKVNPAFEPPTVPHLTLDNLADADRLRLDLAGLLVSAGKPRHCPKNRMTLAPCARAHAPEILAIFNDAILHTTALYDYEPRTTAFMETWFDTKERGNFPVLGAFTEDGTLAGFATYGTFRAFPAFKYSVEHSVYVHPAHRGGGIGKALMQALIAEATTQNYHTLVGAIDSTNSASVHLHTALGFTPCGRIAQAGYKFGRWLDLDFYQLILPTPAKPTDETAGRT